MEVTRRQFLKTTALAGGVLAVGGLGPLFKPSTSYAAANSPTLAKWSQALRGLKLPDGSGDPNGIPVLSSVPDPIISGGRLYKVDVHEFTDLLHPAMGGSTTLWGYSDDNPTLADGITPNANYQVRRHLGGIIIATRHQPVRIRFRNELPNTAIIPIDTTLPGADQGANRIAVHLHGGFIQWPFDGGPFDWWAPNGVHGLSFLNGPGGFFDTFTGGTMTAGEADYFYPNDQSTRLLWYHDHAHGTTRTNAYAGLATGYLILDPTQETALSPYIPGLGATVPLVVQDKVFVHGDPNAGTGTYATDPTWAQAAQARVQGPGSLWYEHIYSPTAFRLLQGPLYLPVPTPVSAIPEFFGDTMLCNGLVHPKMTVLPQRYRFMMLNACNARFLNLNLLQVTSGTEITTDPSTLRPTNTAPGPKMVQIGNEGGYLAADVVHPNTRFFNPAGVTGNMLLGPAERSDFIIDFRGYPDGTEFILYNDAPGPFPGGPPENDYFAGNTATPSAQAGTSPDTRQLLKFIVSGTAAAVPYSPILSNVVHNPVLQGDFIDPPVFVDPRDLTLGTDGYPVAGPPLTPPAGSKLRDLTLNEDFDQYGRLRQLIGTNKPKLVGRGFGLEYLAPATEIVNAGDTEVWRIWNLSADTHPIHFHLVNVQVLSRQPFRLVYGRFLPSGAARGPEPNERGWKETVQMHPGEVITVIMKFDLPTRDIPAGLVIPSSPRALISAAGNGLGLPNNGSVYHEYVYHCHILEHEEHDMMRPLVVKSP